MHGSLFLVSLFPVPRPLFLILLSLLHPPPPPLSRYVWLEQFLTKYAWAALGLSTIAAPIFASAGRAKVIAKVNAEQRTEGGGGEGGGGGGGGGGGHGHDHNHHDSHDHDHGHGKDHCDGHGHGHDHNDSPPSPPFLTKSAAEVAVEAMGKRAEQLAVARRLMLDATDAMTRITTAFKEVRVCVAVSLTGRI